MITSGNSSKITTHALKNLLLFRNDHNLKILRDLLVTLGALSKVALFSQVLDFIQAWLTEDMLARQFDRLLHCVLTYSTGLHDSEMHKNFLVTG